METVQIVLASDANYFPGLLVTSVSMASHASREVALAFHILDGGIGAGNLEFLRKKLAAAHPHVAVKSYDVDAAQFADFPEWNCGSRMAYARLLMAELLSNVEHVLYCDVDFLWTGNVADLWASRSDSVALQACADGWSRTLAEEGRWFRERGLAFAPDRYVCSGLLLVNLRLWRERQIGRRTMDFLAEYPDVQFADQTAFNAVMDDISLLPRKWGRFSREVKSGELPGDWAIHFAGGAPWCSNWWTSLITPSDLLWYRMYGELTGLSARQARRKFIPTREYYKRRLAYWLVATPVVCSCFFAFLKVVGRGIYVPCLKGKRL